MLSFKSSYHFGEIVLAIRDGQYQISLTIAMSLKVHVTGAVITGTILGVLTHDPAAYKSSSLATDYS